MAQAVAKWRKADLMRAFSHWRDALLQGRVGALKKGVSELRKALLAAEARERDLEGDLDAERRAHGSTKTRLAAADATIEEQRAEIERLLRLLKASERSLKLGKAYAAEALRLRRGLASMAAEATDELKQRVADLKEGTFQVGHGVQLQNRVWPHLTHIQCVDFSIEIQDETLRKIRVTAISGTSTVQLN